MCKLLYSVLYKNYPVLVVSDIVLTGFVSDVIIFILKLSFFIAILLLQPTSIFVYLNEKKVA